jgi:hypothetical protein
MPLRSPDTADTIRSAYWSEHLELSLAEEITLLSLDDRTGQTICSYSTYALSAAILAELILLQRLAVEGDVVHVIDLASVDDSLLDEAAATVASSGGNLNWLIRSSLAENQCTRVLNRLVDRGILDRIEKKALGLFRYRRYPAHDGTAETELRARLRSAVLEQTTPDARTRALLGLANAAGLCETFLSTQERIGSAKRITELAANDPVSEALFRAIRDDDSVAAAAAITVSIT